MVHITAGSTLPPTCTCRSASGPSDLARKLLLGVALRLLKLELQPVPLERQSHGVALLDVLYRRGVVAGIDLDIGQLEIAPRLLWLLAHALLSVLQPGQQRLGAVPVLAQDAVD